MYFYNALTRTERMATLPLAQHAGLVEDYRILVACPPPSCKNTLHFMATLLILVTFLTSQNLLCHGQDTIPF